MDTQQFKDLLIKKMGIKQKLKYCGCIALVILFVLGCGKTKKELVQDFKDYKNHLDIVAKEAMNRCQKGKFTIEQAQEMQLEYEATKYLMKEAAGLLNNYYKYSDKFWLKDYHVKMRLASRHLGTIENYLQSE